MKKTIFVIILITILLFAVGYFLFRNNKDNNSYTASRTNNNEIENQIEIKKEKVYEEIELATYSTKLSGKDVPRSRNIVITSNRLNGTQVEPGNIFSFCDIIGECTAEQGYEKADTFDSDGKKIKTYGGGNCQVSSTIYNVVLQIPELEVKERHAHSRRVYYVPKDKDAAVAHGSVDLKFKNNFDVPIKLYINSDLNGVNVRIIKLIEK